MSVLSGHPSRFIREDSLSMVIYKDSSVAGPVDSHYVAVRDAVRLYKMFEHVHMIEFQSSGVKYAR